MSDGKCVNLWWSMWLNTLHPLIPYNQEHTPSTLFFLVSSAGCNLQPAVAHTFSALPDRPLESLSCDHPLSISDPQQATPTFGSHPKLSSLDGSPNPSHASLSTFIPTHPVLISTHQSTLHVSCWKAETEVTGRGEGSLVPRPSCPSVCRLQY